MSPESPTAGSPPSEQESSRLLERYASGEPQALECLLDRHRVEIRQVVAQRIGPDLQARVDGSDVAQETLISAARRIDQFLADRPMPFRWWLRKLALQHLGKARARHRTARKRSVDCEECPVPAASSSIALQLVGAGRRPESEVATNELIDRVHQELERLSTLDQELLTMRYHEKLNNVEIGHVLDLSPDAVNKRHARCLIRLRKAIWE